MTNPVAMRRQLCAELRRLRSAQSLTQRQVAETLDWSQSKVIRIEKGSVAVAVPDLRALLHHYQVEDEAVVAKLIELARGSKRLPFAEYRADFRPETLRYFRYESSAGLIRRFQPLIVPGLVQTEEYARALLANVGCSPEQIDQVWGARNDGAEMPEMFFIIDEALVQRQIGDERIVGRRPARLIERGEHPRVAIQVVPFGASAHVVLILEDDSSRQKVYDPRFLLALIARSARAAALSAVLSRLRSRLCSTPGPLRVRSGHLINTSLALDH